MHSSLSSQVLVSTNSCLEGAKEKDFHLRFVALSSTTLITMTRTSI